MAVVAGVASSLAGGRASGIADQPAATPTPTVTPAPAEAVGLRTLRFVDPRRTVPAPGGRRIPRTLVTEVRYPALGTGPGGDRPDAPPAPGAPRPLVVFAHGFAAAPSTYAPLLRAWTRAGFVVAAPVFPRTGKGTPGGPDRSDLENQPADLHLVISSLLAAAQGGQPPWAGLIDPRRIAVAGHSDGAITALETAFDRHDRDRRVTAAVSLAGAWLTGRHWSRPAAGSPALLAVQGMADATNDPDNASELYGLARSPRYLLWLLGAGHLPPFTNGPQLPLVKRATIAFLDRYLKDDASAEARLRDAGRAPGRARLVAAP